MGTKQVGCFSQKIVDLLNLPLSDGTPIYIGDTNVEHIKTKHPYEYALYYPHIEEILSTPDYIGKNPSDGSISYVKLYQFDNEYIRVAVRISPKGIPFVKSLHLLSTCNAERYIKHGTLIKLDK